MTRPGLLITLTLMLTPYKKKNLPAKITLISTRKVKNSFVLKCRANTFSRLTVAVRGGFNGEGRIRLQEVR